MKTYIFVNDNGDTLKTKAETWQEALAKFYKYLYMREKDPDNAKIRCLKKCETITDGMELFDAFSDDDEVLYFGEDTDSAVNKLQEV
jgi:hypothetical protein